ncbi:penicillin-binding protein 2 [Patescibacteria group bacterium]|nr:penicillin-binding protein 2 [Patescibacteria group bacterium]MBU1034372.1 penicillin-binding protein 2 [Patescibacteria group bacterium]MBU1630133.1 penicillin-binding protein 2 [Patescibacteria group bacterium]MBU1907793.1 penicillin-binding protein 2 [Patescibacteria group bacterium]
MTANDPFQWHDDGGLGHSVPIDSPAMISHEVMYENDISHVKEQPLYLGRAIPRKRFIGIFLILFIVFAVLFSRAYWMQVVKGSEYRALAESNRIRSQVILPKRGVIYDRNGQILAENMPSFDVRAVERLLPQDAATRAEVLVKLGKTLNLQIADMERIFASSTDPDESVVLKRDVPYDRAITVKILAAQEAGIEVAVGSKRRYATSPQFMSLSHILGYVGAITVEELDEKRAEGYRQIDTIGKTGVEDSYESILRGQPGERLYEVDARHHITAVVGEKDAVDGRDLMLTIDADLQQAAEMALRKEMEKDDLKRGAVIAMNPQNGEILAAVSWPAYDNNIFSGAVSSSAYLALLDNPDNPLLPRAWSGIYPSGSTAKPVIATAALAEGVITPQTTVHSVGGLQIGPWFFPDWKAGGHGSVNVRSAIAWSVNTFFYYIGGGYNNFVGLGVDRLTKWMRNFGLGDKTGLDVFGELSGFVPSQEWKKKTKGEDWFIGDTYNLSIGQGDLLVTPLQVALFTAEVANGGFRIRPHFALTKNPEEMKGDEIASSETIKTVRLGMRDTVIYGSGRALAGFPVPVAGKTGTAQWRSDRPNHAWFTAFAPFENPEIVVTVLLEEGVEGSSTAVPVAREVLDAWLKGRK